MIGHIVLGKIAVLIVGVGIFLGRLAHAIELLVG